MRVVVGDSGGQAVQVEECGLILVLRSAWREGVRALEVQEECKKGREGRITLTSLHTNENFRIG